MKIYPEPPEIPQGFGVHQSSGAFRVISATQSGRGLPQSRTLPRCDRSNE
jgi:hypothetical protein